MARSIWKGSIAFGLVQIPVDLYSAEKADELSFHLLDRHDFAKVGYEHINKKTGEKVAWDDVVRGYEHSKGKYVILSDNDFKEANIEATHTLDLSGFVDASEIDPFLFDKPYYLAPGRVAGKAYALLRETLRKMGKYGVGKIVMRSRQHLGVVFPHGDVLGLVLLRYQHEIRKADDLPVPESNLKKLGITAKETAMAEQLVQGMLEKWDPTGYRDDYRDDLLALIDKRAKAGEVNAIVDRPAPQSPKSPGNVVDLMDMLKKSLEGKKAPKKGKTEAPRRAKPTAKKPALAKSA